MRRSLRAHGGASDATGPRAVRRHAADARLETRAPQVLKPLRRFPFPVSGRPDSNRRPSAWEADALPTELRPRYLLTAIGRSHYTIPATDPSRAVSRLPPHTA